MTETQRILARKFHGRIRRVYVYAPETREVIDELMTRFKEKGILGEEYRNYANEFTEFDPIELDEKRELYDLADEYLEGLYGLDEDGVDKFHAAMDKLL